MSDVFISYPHQAQADASLFARTLEQKGLSTWVAQKDLPKNANPKSEIDGALRDAIAVVFLVYSQWEATPWVQHEYMNALDSYWSGRTKMLVPLLIGPNAEAPTFLRQWQSLKVPKVQNRSDWERAAGQLASWIKSNQQVRNKPSKKEKLALNRRLNAIVTVAKKWQSDSDDSSRSESDLGSTGKIVFRSSRTGEFKQRGKKKSRSSQEKSKR